MKNVTLFAAAALFLAACGQKPAEGNAAATTTTTPAAATTTTQPAAATTTQPAATADYKAMLQGKWADKGKADNGMEITATSMNLVVKGKVVGGSDYEYDAACKTCADKGAQDAGFGCIIEHGEQDWCYVITKLSDTELEYKMDAGKGNTVSMTRVK